MRSKYGWIKGWSKHEHYSQLWIQLKQFCEKSPAAPLDAFGEQHWELEEKPVSNEGADQQVPSAYYTAGEFLKIMVKYAEHKIYHLNHF